MNPYKPVKAKVDGIEYQTEDTYLLRINTDIIHKPGQFMEAGLPGYGESPISICSYAQDYVELCVRAVGSVTNKIITLKKGDYIFLRGPFGNGYPIEDFENKEVCLIGGGTGVAPMRSIMMHIIQNKEKYKRSKLFLGFRSYDDMLFREDFNLLSKNFELNISLDKPDVRWRGFVGFVTDLIKKSDISSDAIAVICGPPIMLKLIVPILKEKGIKEQQIYMSLERLMYCGIGKCGHCLVNGKYVCRHGPVFRYNQGKEMID